MEKDLYFSKRRRKKTEGIKEKKADFIVKTAVFSALSFVLYYVKIPAAVFIPLFPGFLDIQFSNLPALIAGFLMGPSGGCLVVIVRTVLKLPFSVTAGIGELADLLIGLATVGVGSFVYKRNHTKRGGVFALIGAVAAWIGTALIVNRYLLIPTFIKVTEAEEMFESLLNFLQVEINDDKFLFYYNLYVTLPFNGLLSVTVSLITFFVYKRISLLIGKLKGETEEENKEKKASG